MTLPKCEKCGRQLQPGDEAYESDWKVIDINGEKSEVRLEKRYECAPRCPR